MSAIELVHGRQILDSRGNPTVEVEMQLASGAHGRAAVPSGASTGEFEATELRDGGPAWGGKGVTRAVANVDGEIATAVRGMDVADQEALDRALIELDGTPNKSRLGANAILGRLARGGSRGRRRAAASRCGASLGGAGASVLPVPMMNVLNGGAHADNKVDFQEFMVVPCGAESFSRCLQMGDEVFHALKRTLHDRGLSTAVGDEGGFAPDLGSNEEALRDARRRRSKLRACGPAMTLRSRSTRPPASCSRTAPTASSTRAARSARTSWPTTGPISPAATRSSRSRTVWTRRTGTAGRRLTDRLGDRVQLVGDDLFVTNTERLRRGIETGVANSILIKVNQIGTLTETLRSDRDGPRSRLHRGDEPPLRRDRGRHDRRPGGRHRVRSDQDRRTVALGPRREVQPAAAHRGAARRARAFSRAASAFGRA